MAFGDVCEAERASLVAEAVKTTHLPGKFHGQRSLSGYGQGVAKSQTQLSDYAHRCTKLKM